MSPGPPNEAPQARPALSAGRWAFTAMAATYMLGVCNDNFFKQGMSLLAVAAGKDALQGHATTVFTLPWLLLAAPAGWLADRFAKHRVVVGAKALELLAMLAGAAGVLLMSWPLMFVMLFLMASQSVLFSPALNGAIPEVFPPEKVLAVNARMKMLTTCSILVGILLGGLALDAPAPMAWGIPAGRWLLAGGMVALAGVGLAVSLAAPATRPAAPTATMPWLGPIDTLRQLWRFGRDPLLAGVTAVDTGVWFVGALQILLINALGVGQLGFSEANTSLLAGAELLGLAVGGLLAARLPEDRWRRYMPPAMGALGAVLAATTLLPYLPAAARWPVAMALFLASGIPGGLMLVPLEMFFQVRPRPCRRGAVIAAANFAAFAGIALSGQAYVLLNAWFTPAESLGLLGAGCLLAVPGVWAALRDRPGRPA